MVQPTSLVLLADGGDSRRERVCVSVRGSWRERERDRDGERDGGDAPPVEETPAARRRGDVSMLGLHAFFFLGTKRQGLGLYL